MERSGHLMDEDHKENGRKSSHLESIRDTAGVDGTIDLLDLDVDKSAEIAESKTDADLSQFPDSRELEFDYKTFKEKIIYTMFIALSFLALGLIAAQMGPSFLDLLVITQSSLAKGTSIFTGASLGYLVGSLVTGVMHEKINIHLLLFICIFGQSALTAVVPWCSSLILMVITLFIRASFMGALDTSGNTVCVTLWGKENGPYMQVLHFAFAIGGILAPLITEPFLAPKVEHVNKTNTLSDMNGNTTTTTVYINSSYPSIEDTSLNHQPQVMRLYLAYTIVSIMSTLTALPFLFFFLKNRTKYWKQNKNKPTEKGNSLSTFPNIFILIILMLFYFCYCGVEDATFNFLTSFVVKHLGWSKSDGSLVVSVFWGSFAFGRFAAIFETKVFTPSKILVVHLVLLIVAEIVLLWSEALPVLTWVCSSISGLAMSAIFPVGFSWTEESLMKMTSRVASFILVAASIGTTVTPILVGYLFDKYSPKWLTYILIFESMLIVVLFILLSVISNKIASFNSHHTRENEISVQPIEIIPMI